MPDWVDEKIAAEDKANEAASNEKQREASPPPLYGATPTGASTSSISPSNQQFPVPSVRDAAAPATTFAPPPGPPPGFAAPNYEPFDFRAAWSANQPNGKAQYSAPNWHKVPTYEVHMHRDLIEFQVPPPPPRSVPCSCPAQGDLSRCGCGRTMDPLYRCEPRDNKGGRSFMLSTANENPDLPYDASLIASKSLLGSKLEVKASNGEKTGVVIRTKQAQSAVTFNDHEGRDLEWVSLPARHELIRKQDQALIAVLHGADAAGQDALPSRRTTAKLELTAFAWSRMPQDGLYCDVDGCPLNPIFGFVFRCQSCSDANLAVDDTFDVCEAHLRQAASEHNPNHRFVRIPRIYAPPDSEDEPLLSLDQLLAERKQLEVVLLTLGVALLQKF
ncbi:hypothetical protein IE81DRAFT_322780 [Ceraceosorus guamensis]|uniref:Uncharacterized protein n=1 Tax=Ceraceosorus guamensis TaxID=1522189 RepID=A0A316VZH5_9BASI|nr:hypothetical protein IE81DRAFT_322780 [Ceraceosorus guamensis]PWN43067.1 hypothetical protein IE81DRAFT_322780 [Ceraceosorus guamensis]